MSKTQQRIVTRRALTEKSYRQGVRYAKTGIFPKRVWNYVAFRRGYFDGRPVLKAFTGGRGGRKVGRFERYVNKIKWMLR